MAVNNATASALLQRLVDQRRHWVDLGGGKRLQYLRPPEVELPQFIGGVKVEHVIQYACGWDGFTEADLLGAAVGSSDPAPFGTDLWAEWVRDNTDVLPGIAQHMADTASAFLARRAETAKNSRPS